MYHTKAQIEELVKRASTPVRPVSIVTQTSRSPKHFKLIAQKNRGSGVASFVILLICAVVLVVASVATVVFGIEEDLPLWLWAIFVPCLSFGAGCGAVIGVAHLQARTPVFVKWCNTKRTITYTFKRRLRTYHYVFAYKDCLGFQAKEYRGDEGPDVHVLKMAIRVDAKGKAGTGFRRRAGALRNFTLCPAEGRFGPLREPLRWDDERRAAAPAQHTGVLSFLVGWIGKFVRDGAKGDGCEFFDVTVDDWSMEEVEKLRQEIAQVTGLPPSLPSKFQI
jgi:hypothetical protein